MTAPINVGDICTSLEIALRSLPVTAAEKVRRVLGATHIHAKQLFFLPLRRGTHLELRFHCICALEDASSVNIADDIAQADPSTWVVFLRPDCDSVLTAAAGPVLDCSTTHDSTCTLASVLEEFHFFLGIPRTSDLRQLDRRLVQDIRTIQHLRPRPGGELHVEELCMDSPIAIAALGQNKLMLEAMLDHDQLPDGYVRYPVVPLGASYGTVVVLGASPLMIETDGILQLTRT